MKKKVLITGGLGFIGKSLIENMQDTSDIYILDNMRSIENFVSIEKLDIYSNKNIKNIMVGDIKNREDCLKATQDIDILIHLAANGSVVESVKDPIDNFDNNVLGTFNILHAAAINGVKKIVFASTGGALMGNCELPVSEKSLPSPISPYGASKHAGEGYCHAFGNLFNISVSIVRFANVYGPNSAHKKGLINVAMKAIKENTPITIFGDGTSSRDFLYVDDICQGILKAMNKMHDGIETFHLSSGHESKITDVIHTLLDVSGKKDHPVIFGLERDGEVKNNYASYEKAAAILGFLPQTNLHDGLKNTWMWFIAQDEDFE